MTTEWYITIMLGCIAILAFMANVRLVLLRERMLEEFAEQTRWHRFRTGKAP